MTSTLEGPLPKGLRSVGLPLPQQTAAVPAFALDTKIQQVLTNTYCVPPVLWSATGLSLLFSSLCTRALAP